MGAGATAGTGLLGMLLSLLVAEKSGFDVAGLPGGSVLQEFSDKISKQAMENIEEAMKANVGSLANGNVDLNLEVTDPSKSVASHSAAAAGRGGLNDRQQDLITAEAANRSRALDAPRTCPPQPGGHALLETQAAGGQEGTERCEHSAFSHRRDHNSAGLLSHGRTRAVRLVAALPPPPFKNLSPNNPRNWVCFALKMSKMSYLTP